MSARALASSVRKVAPWSSEIACQSASSLPPSFARKAAARDQNSMVSFSALLCLSRALLLAVFRRFVAAVSFWGCGAVVALAVLWLAAAGRCCCSLVPVVVPCSLAARRCSSPAPVGLLEGGALCCKDPPVLMSSSWSCSASLVGSTGGCTDIGLSGLGPALAVVSAWSALRLACWCWGARALGWLCSGVVVPAPRVAGSAGCRSVACCCCCGACSSGWLSSGGCRWLVVACCVAPASSAAFAVAIPSALLAIAANVAACAGALP